MTGSSSLFLEVDCSQITKEGQFVCGDAFKSKYLPSENRAISVLSDGLGSGVKANILSMMTATMAVRFFEANRDIRRASEVIMNSLPMCQVRRISYATFSIVDAVMHGQTRIIEQGNPPYLLIRNGAYVPVERTSMIMTRWDNRELRLSELEMQPEDRLVVFSDGVSQAGLGAPNWKLGWRIEGCADYILKRLEAAPNLSARQLARDVVDEAVRKEPERFAKDDISCAVLYFRRARRLLLMTGPPYDHRRDREAALRLQLYPGRTAVCGGTTANIVARELGLKVTTCLGKRRGGLPPVCSMNGIDLVTEGILTLTRVASILESHETDFTADAAGQLAELLINSDQVELLVGTRINEAHQDPSLPVDLEIRRNIVKRIAAALRDLYLKEVSIEYI